MLPLLEEESLVSFDVEPPTGLGVELEVVLSSVDWMGLLAGAFVCGVGVFSLHLFVFML